MQNIQVNYIPSQTIQHLAVSLIGCKYKVNGTNPDDGFDCWGLAWHFLTSLGYEIPNKYDYALRSDPRAIAKLIGKAARQDEWKRLELPEPLCIAGMGRGKLVTHVGIWLGIEKKVIHATRTHGVVCEDLRRLENRNNYTTKFYKWQSYT